MTSNCHLHSFGTYVPDLVLSNDYFETIVDTSDQWIVDRTGIRFRHKIDHAQNASDLGLLAAKKALAKSGISPQSLTHVIVATCTPDHLSPSVACIIAGELDAPHVMAFDLQAACAGFIYGLSVCRSIIAGEPDATVLFVCSEALTRRINWSDRNTCILFGDAAAAAVLSGSGTGAIMSVEDVICQSDGKQKDLIVVGGGTSCRYEDGQTVDKDFFISMQGRETYKFAVREMVNVCEKIMRQNSLTIDDIDLFVPHQANMRIIEAVGSRLNIAGDKVFTNVANYGNTSSASIPLALAEADSLGLIPKNSRVMVSAFGAGLTWGAALLKF